MVKVVKTEFSHLDKVAVCHAKAFPNALATALGKKYLKVMLSWYLSTSKTFLFHLESDGNVVGYCGSIISDGTLGTGSSSGMAQHSFSAAVKALLIRPWVFFHPEILAKWSLLFRNLLMKLGLRKKRHFTKEQSVLMSQDPHVGLVVIGVDPSFHGKGYGSLLLKEFERSAKVDYGIHKLQLSVKADNAKAIRAYQNNGWLTKGGNAPSLTMYKFMD
jgi:ribosomal protein S18 acetylase RimI-like enzyme